MVGFEFEELVSADHPSEVCCKRTMSTSLPSPVETKGRKSSWRPKMLVEYCSAEPSRTRACGLASWLMWGNWIPSRPVSMARGCPSPAGLVIGAQGRLQEHLLEEITFEAARNLACVPATVSSRACCIVQICPAYLLAQVSFTWIGRGWYATPSNATRNGNLASMWTAPRTTGSGPNRGAEAARYLPRTCFVEREWKNSRWPGRLPASSIITF